MAGLAPRGAESCVSFWLEHGMDKEHGGVYTRLTRDGKVFPQTKACGCRGAKVRTFAPVPRVRAKSRNGWTPQNPAWTFWRSTAPPHGGDRLYFTVGIWQSLRQRRYCFRRLLRHRQREEYGQTGEREHLERARKKRISWYDLNHGMPDPTEWAPKPLRRRAWAAHWRT